MPLTLLALPERVQLYLTDVERACAQQATALVSLIVFGSAAKGGFGEISDVDLIAVVSDETTRDARHRLRDAITALEIAHGFRPVRSPGAFQARVERASGHLFPCMVCTRAALLSRDVVRILDLRAWEAPFLDRIVLASIVASSMTVRGEDLLPQVTPPPVRRLDIFKAWFSLSCQIVLAAMTYPVLPEATKYAMGALKHSLHSCYFCFHARTAALDDEVAFFEPRAGGSRAFRELLALRRDYRPSFAFVLRCAPAIARLHLTTARRAIRLRA